MPFTICNGDGQVVGRGQQTPELLQVLLKDGGGAPIAGQTVTWSLLSGVGAPYPLTSVTDSNGVASTHYFGGDGSSVSPVEKYKTCVVQASTPGYADLYFHETTINNFSIGATSPFGDTMPGCALLFPPGYGTRLIGQASQTLPGYIKIQVGFYAGSTFVTPLPYVSLQLVQTDQVFYQNSAYATALGGPVMSDASGIATLDVTFGSVVASGLANLKIGLASYDGSYLCYWPMILICTLTADAQIQVAQAPVYGYAGQPWAYSYDSASPLHVRVLDSSGVPAAGTAMTWTSVTGGAVSFFNSSTVTDADGNAQTGVLLGLTPGSFQISVGALSQTVLLPVVVVDPSDPTVPPPVPGAVATVAGSPPTTGAPSVTPSSLLLSPYFRR